MLISSFVFSLIAMICSLACLVIMLAKNFFSSHVIQTQFVDPFKDMMPTEIGKGQLDPFQDIDLPLSNEDIDQLKGRKAKFDI